MNGIHDMGGMHGFGSVVKEENEPVFHEEWEGRVYALRGASGVGGGRFAIESLDPARYLADGYYEKWLDALENTVLARGVISKEELAAKSEFFRQHPEATPPRRENPQLAREVLERRLTPRPFLNREVGVMPSFEVGDSVKARNINPRGHTRLPRYIRGKRGTVERYYGVHDLSASEGGETQAIYSVRFEAKELWGDDAGENEAVYIDMWESYLEPA